MYFPIKVKKLSDNQISNLVKGRGVRVQFGKDDTIMMSKEQIKKLDRAMKKGKGITLTLDPFQQMHHQRLKGSGSKVGKAFKNLGKAIKSDVGSIGKAIEKGTKKTFSPVEQGFNKTFNPALGRDIVSGLEMVGRPTGKFLIEQGLPILANAGAEGLMTAIGQPELAPIAGALAERGASYGAKELSKKAGLGIKKRGRPSKEGQGLFKSLHKMGIKGVKKPLVKGLKTFGKDIAKTASQVAGQAISEYTGNPMLGQKVASMADNIAETTIDKGFKQGLRASKAQVKNMAVEAVDDWIDENLDEKQRQIAQNAMAGKYKSASDLIYDVSDVYTGAGMRTKGRRTRKGGALMPAGY